MALRRVVHADWGVRPGARWLTEAVLDEAGQFHVRPSQPVGDLRNLFERFYDRNDTTLFGFDFPIGIPLHYAQLANIQAFLHLLPELGNGEWAQFFELAENANDIGIHRPFYPFAPGGTTQAHLTQALQANTINDLKRVCEQPHGGRQAAECLFWTLGPKQVGRGAIVGWRDLIAPAMDNPALDTAIWPFEGHLFDLIAEHHLVIAETYPAEFYAHLNMHFPPQQGKRNQAGRIAAGAPLIDWAAQHGLGLDPALRNQLANGFGPEAEGEDPFDATVGAFGMLNVILRNRAPGAPNGQQGDAVEGWILGQHP